MRAWSQSFTKVGSKAPEIGAPGATDRHGHFRQIDRLDFQAINLHFSFLKDDRDPSSCKGISSFPLVFQGRKPGGRLLNLSGELESTGLDETRFQRRHRARLHDAAGGIKGIRLYTQPEGPPVVLLSRHKEGRKLCRLPQENHQKSCGKRVQGPGMTYLPDA